MAKDYTDLEWLTNNVTEFAKQAYDKGYDKGYEQGYEDRQAQQIASDDVFRESCEKAAYEKGLNDAWECARKIMLSDEDGGIAHIDIQKIFGGSYYQAMMNYSASEVIDKLKEYEEKKKADTIQQERDCEHCSKVYGTLGCCTTVSNEWVYSCEEGHKQYAERHKADDEIKVGDEVYIVMENYPSVVTCIFSESGLDNPKAVHITQSGKYAVTPLSQLHKTGRHFDQIVEILEQLKEAQDEDNTSAG